MKIVEYTQYTVVGNERELFRKDAEQQGFSLACDWDMYEQYDNEFFVVQCRHIYHNTKEFADPLCPIVKYMCKDELEVGYDQILQR